MIKFLEEYIDTNPDLKQLFTREDGSRLKAGDTMYRKKFASTLEYLALNGGTSFYTGYIAESLVDTIQKSKGIATLKDFKDYAVHLNPAIYGTFRGKKVVTSPLPTSGPVLITILNILEHHNLTERNSLYYHHLVESFKFGYAQRTYYGDPLYQN